MESSIYHNIYILYCTFLQQMVNGVVLAVFYIIAYRQAISTLKLILDSCYTLDPTMSSVSLILLWGSLSGIIDMMEKLFSHLWTQCLSFSRRLCTSISLTDKSKFSLWIIIQSHQWDTSMMEELEIFLILNQIVKSIPYSKEAYASWSIDMKRNGSVRFMYASLAFRN